MDTVIYRATAENLPIALLQIPHHPSRPKIESVAKSLIEQTNHWDVISKWWYPAASAISEYPCRQPTSLSLERAITLNRFMTNGVSTRDGEYKSIQSSSLSAETFYRRYLKLPEGGSTRQILKAAISNAIRLRAEQVFYDGNHRTALLLLYEVLAERKLLLQATPMTLYILLSNRSDFSEHGKLSWEEVENRMFQHCRSRLKFLDTVPTGQERPGLFANEVKTLEIGNSLFNQLAEQWYSTDTRYLNSERREIGRQFKCLNRGLYEQFYRLCVLGSWEGPPG
jgi:prophage maintenance system killer protein